MRNCCEVASKVEPWVENSRATCMPNFDKSNFKLAFPEQFTTFDTKPPDFELNDP